MPSSVISTLRPSFASEALKDKVQTCAEFIGTELPKIYYLHKKSAEVYSWFVYKQWKWNNDAGAINFTNQNYWPYNNSELYSYLMNVDSSANGGYLLWMKFVNDFAAMDTGLLCTSCESNITIMPGYISKKINTRTDFNTAKFYVPNSNNALNAYHTLIGSTNPYTSNIDDFKIFASAGNDLAYIGFVNTDRCIVATRAYKLDDPTESTSVMIISCINSEIDDYRNMREANVIDILMGESRVPITYVDSINTIPKSTSFNKLVLHKFVQNGYYFDHIYAYTGILPSNHFYYNGSEYLKIACDLLIKF